MSIILLITSILLLCLDMRSIYIWQSDEREISGVQIIVSKPFSSVMVPAIVNTLGGTQNNPSKRVNYMNDTFRSIRAKLWKENFKTDRTSILVLKLAYSFGLFVLGITMGAAKRLLTFSEEMRRNSSSRPH